MIETNSLYEYIVRGFYPELYDNQDLDAGSFYADYVTTYLERDVSDLITLKESKGKLLLMTSDACVENLPVLGRFAGLPSQRKSEK